MNDHKLKRLFELSHGETPPAAREGFDERVMAAIRREPHSVAESVSLWDQIGRLFPRLAFGVVLIIGVCVLADFCTLTESSSLTAGIDQISEQWLFAANGN